MVKITMVYIEKTIGKAIAIENGHRNSGFTQLENGGSFHSFLLTFTRGYFGAGIRMFRLRNDDNRQPPVESVPTP